MAKSGSSMDVEDVLSSIRRLVSEETKLGEPLRATDRRAEAAPTAPADPAPEAADDDGRLVLTDALRVAEEAAAAEAPAAPAAEPTTANLSAEDETPSPVRPRRRATDRPRFQLLDDLVAETLGRRRAPDDEGADAAADLAAHDAEEHAEAAETDAPAPGGAAPAAEDVAALDAEAEAALAEALQTEELAPDPVAELPEGGAGAEDAAPEATEAQEPLASREGERQGLQLFDEDSDVLDEETLRIMVAQIVREELLGELGDRITRNVRKLVRREINRALAGKEFE